MKSLSVALTDIEIKELFEYAINMQHMGNKVQAGQVDIFAFDALVKEAYK